MAGLKTPQLADLDDPLGPRPPAPAPPVDPAPAPARSSASRKPAARRASASPSSRGVSLANEELVAVFARVPESLSDALADAVRALNADRPRRARVSQQDVVGAVLERYVAATTATELAEIVDEYRKRLRG